MKIQSAEDLKDIRDDLKEFWKFGGSLTLLYNWILWQCLHCLDFLIDQYEAREEQEGE